MICRRRDAMISDEEADLILRKAFKNYQEHSKKTIGFSGYSEDEKGYQNFKKSVLRDFYHWEREELENFYDVFDTRLEMGISFNEFYRIWVYANFGDIYEGIEIPDKFKNRGQISRKPIDCEENLEACKYYIKNLHSESKIILYHGTDRKTAYLAVTRGLDFNVPPRVEIYPERYLKTGKSYRKGGIYVTPHLWTSGSFGRYILEILKEAKHLMPPNWTVQEALDTNVDLDEYYEKYLPNSFRPSVSEWLLTSGEPQALLKESLKPEDVLFVHHEGKKYTRKEFIDLVEKDSVNCKRG